MRRFCFVTAVALACLVGCQGSSPAPAPDTPRSQAPQTPWMSKWLTADGHGQEVGQNAPAPPAAVDWFSVFFS